MELIHTNPDWFNDALNKEHQSKFVEVNGAKIEYMEWGNPENQSVIMLHGTNAHAHWFKFIGAMLSDKYHFVVMSFSGMGGSDWRSFYTRDTFVDDVWGVVNDAGMENPVIVGHSFGGMVSLITASKHSSEMAGLLLVDFVVYTPEEHHEWYEDRTPARPPRIVKERDELIKRFRLMPPQDCENGWFLRYIAEHSIIKNEEGWRWRFDDSLFMTLRRLHNYEFKFKCPALFIAGGKSLLLESKIMKYIREAFKGSMTVEVIEDAAHHVPLDSPLQLASLLNHYLQEWKEKK